WAFLDKAFGLGYSTTPERAWIRGGTPAQGFLSHLDPGKPFTEHFVGISSPWADWGFMLGMLAIGVALTLGIGMRLAAFGGAVMMTLMYLAEMPFVTLSPESAATNPLVDYHIIYALLVIVLAVIGAGNYLGAGPAWSAKVGKNRWLI
ncbi:MAG: DoxX family protein, partial [Actinomycetaceae bacterium]|nr:DoxX family protein [Actinomycetaceae bacterium]